MTNVANCKKCGALFVQTAKRDICDKCFEEQFKLVNEINDYVINAPVESIFLDNLLTKFNLKLSEFEELYQAGKFVKISQKVTMKSKELDELKKQFDVYKAKMESLLISQLELLKEVNKD